MSSIKSNEVLDYIISEGKKLNLQITGEINEDEQCVACGVPSMNLTIKFLQNRYEGGLKVYPEVFFIKLNLHSYSEFRELQICSNESSKQIEVFQNHLLQVHDFIMSVLKKFYP